MTYFVRIVNLAIGAALKEQAREAENRHEEALGVRSEFVVLQVGDTILTESAFENGIKAVEYLGPVVGIASGPRPLIDTVENARQILIRRCLYTLNQLGNLWQLWGGTNGEHGLWMGGWDRTYRRPQTLGWACNLHGHRRWQPEAG